jgi:hypothetical protein
MNNQNNNAILINNQMQTQLQLQTQMQLQTQTLHNKGVKSPKCKKEQCQEFMIELQEKCEKNLPSLKKLKKINDDNIIIPTIRNELYIVEYHLFSIFVYKYRVYYFYFLFNMSI